MTQGHLKIAIPTRQRMVEPIYKELAIETGTQMEIKVALVVATKTLSAMYLNQTSLGPFN